MALTPEAVGRGAVVLVRLPGDKARPAVVIRSDLLFELPYATVLPITTEIRAGFSLRIDLVPNQENGLRAVSQVMTDWPQTMRFTDMGDIIGRVDLVTMRMITRQVAVVLGIGVNTGRPRRTAGAGQIEPSGAG